MCRGRQGIEYLKGWDPFINKISSSSITTTTTNTTSSGPGLNFDDFLFKLVMEIGLLLILEDLSDPIAYRIQLPGKFHYSFFRTC